MHRPIAAPLRLLLDDRFILTLILFNSVTIFALAFPGLSAAWVWRLETLDHLLTLCFGLEMLVKVRHLGFRTYISTGWNRLDFVLVLCSTPAALALFFPELVASMEFFLILRLVRIFKFFRFLRFIPGIQALLHSIGRALRASVLVIIGFFVFNIIVAVLTTYLYRDIAPEFFGNPLLSLYNIFKVFTVEGWFEIPDAIMAKTGTSLGIVTKLYFVLLLMTGGVLGLSLVNSIFVDAMVMDNHESLERKIAELNSKLDRILAAKGLLPEEDSASEDGPQPGAR